MNHVSSLNGGKTPLHFAIENKLPERFIKFLLYIGADPHIEDNTRLDCCDKACPNGKKNKYPGIEIFSKKLCYKKSELRKVYLLQKPCNISKETK